MYMHTYTQTYLYTYTYIYTCTIHTYMHTHIHTNAYAHVCTDRKSLQQRLNVSSNIIDAHTHPCAYARMHTHIHICAQPAASVFVDVYIGVKIHLCNIHTCPCTSAQNTCKVHVTLTAKKCTYTWGGYPSWSAAQSPVHEERRISAEQPQPTAAHRTITTARCPDHIRLSALVWSQSTQFIIHASSQLVRGPPKRGHFPAILEGFFDIKDRTRIK